MIDGWPPGGEGGGVPQRRNGARGERRAGASGGRGEGRGSAVPGSGADAPDDPESVARAICLLLLTGQPRTRAELATALARRGVPAEASEAVLGRFAEVGLIDDRAFAEAWVGSRHAGRGLARRALAAELRRRGVDAGTVGEAVDLLDPEAEECTAHELVRRRLPSSAGLEPPVRVRRLVGMLSRRGYPAALAARVVRSELAADGDDPGDLDGLADLDAVDPDIET